MGKVCELNTIFSTSVIRQT